MIDAAAELGPSGKAQEFRAPTKETGAQGQKPGFRDKVLGFFGKKSPNLQASSEPVKIAGRAVPEFGKPPESTFTLPDRPHGFPRPENFGREESQEPVIGIDTQAPVIRKTPEGPVINAAGEEKPESMREGFSRIEELVPEDRRKELDVTAEEVAQLEDEDEVRKKVLAIQDPTDREYTARKAASIRSLSKLTHGGQGGSYSAPEKEELERVEFTRLRALSFPPVSNKQQSA